MTIVDWARSCSATATSAAAASTAFWRAMRSLDDVEVEAPLPLVAPVPVVLDPVPPDRDDELVEADEFGELDELDEDRLAACWASRESRVAELVASDCWADATAAWASAPTGGRPGRR